MPAIPAIFKQKRFLIPAGIVLAVFIFIEFFLSYFVYRYVNYKLNQIPDYRAHIEWLHVDLWRGAYSIEGLDLKKIRNDVPVPFLAVKRVDFNVQWEALLFHREIVGDVEFFSPEVNFVVEEKEAVAAPEPESSKNVLQQLAPLKLDRILIHDGSGHFRDFTKEPPIDLRLTGIEATVRNLTNSRELAKSLMATLQARGQVMDHGDFSFYLTLDPFAKSPTFEGRMQAAFDLREINDFLKHYLAIEANGGRVEIYIEGAAAKGEFQGYIKPFLLNDEFEIKDADKSVTEAVKGAVVKGVASIFENRGKQDHATKISFTGSFKDPEPQVLTAVLNFLRHALLAIPQGFEEGESEPHVTPSGDVTKDPKAAEASQATPQQTD